MLAPVCIEVWYNTTPYYAEFVGDGGDTLILTVSLPENVELTRDFIQNYVHNLFGYGYYPLSWYRLDEVQGIQNTQEDEV